MFVCLACWTASQKFLATDFQLGGPYEAELHTTLADTQHGEFYFRADLNPFACLPA